MCGIVGGHWRNPNSTLQARLDAAVLELQHRGPNDRGCEMFHAAYGMVALGHTRLSIIDLTQAGHQPMYSQDGRYGLVFNGEIYNYRELRDELKQLGYTFFSDSDTEVLLSAWACWGKQCLVRFEGMFAFVVHDRVKGTLTCVRDAFGIKPFFYERQQDSFIFASEQRALILLRQQKSLPNLQRSYDYLVHAEYDSNDQTFIQDVFQLRPGHLLEIDLITNKTSVPKEWWRPRIEPTTHLSFDQATEAVREQFLRNIRVHLRSDVRVGATLSGGIDSSAIVCAMRHIEPDLPINTFSFIARGSDLSEEVWVDRINDIVGAKAHKISATGEDLLRDLDAMIVAQGEPFASSSIYAQYLVCQSARKNDVSVTLDGQGADELMAGYSGYPGHRLLSLLDHNDWLGAHQFARRWGEWPGRSYRLAGMELGRILLPNALYRYGRKWLGRNFEPRWLQIDQLAGSGVALVETRPPSEISASGRRVAAHMAHSLQHRGLPALLRHGDRNSMKFSVESRVPFLTIQMADLMLSLPESYLISPNGETKSVFRAAMRGIVPDEVLDRRDKIGFATPEKDWVMKMSAPIRTWLQSAYDIPFINAPALLQEFDAIIAGKIRFSSQVWRWINFIRWYQNVMP